MVGTFTPVSAAGRTEGSRAAYRFCLALADLGTGKIVSKGLARSQLEGVDSTPLPAFRDSLALLRAGDRVRFRPVGAEECAWIDAEVAAGRYVHDIVEYQVFSVDRYLDWEKAQKAGVRA